MKNLFENWRRYLLETDGQKAADSIPIEVEPEETEEEDVPDVPTEPLDDPEDEPALS